MKFYMMHLMPYADLDLDYDQKHNSAWITLPNSYYDPKKGAKLYNRYLDELEYADQLGFDGICVNEHHQNAYGLMPQPGVMAGALARRTKKVKIAILGRALPLLNNPVTVAEEFAMVDNITEGRLIAGFVRGIGAEYHAWSSNPALSHERFHEAHDLIVRAWTETGPFAFEGDQYHFEYVNLWPRPYQNDPHPPIWIPSQGSSETIEWASHPSRRYTYLQTFTPVAISTSSSPSSLTLDTLPISPPWVMISSPRRSDATMARCSFIFFCCGRIIRKYMIAKIRISGMNCAKAAPEPAAPEA